MDSPNSHVGKLPAVEVKNIFKSYGVRKSKTEILKGIDLNIATGSIYGLLGPSGCGKTTLLKCIVGRIRPDCGEMRVLGHKPGSANSAIPGLGVGYMPQELALYNELTIAETISFFGRLHNMSRGRVLLRMHFLLELLHLPEASQLINKLSLGQQRRVSFAIALLHEPPLVILDEPTVGLDPLLRQTVWEHLLELSQSGEVTVVITTHYMEEARRADEVGFMRNGRILLEGKPENLQCGRDTLEDVFLEICSKDTNAVLDPTKEAESMKGAEFTKEKITKEINNGQCLNEKGSKFNGWSFLPNWTCIIAMVIKNYQRMSRTISTVVFQFLLPTLHIIIFCVTMGTIPHDLKLAVVNNDSIFGSSFLENFDNHVISQIPVPDVPTGIAMVRNGIAWGVLAIPHNFSSGIVERYTMPSRISLEMLNASFIHVWLDMTDAEIAFTLERTFLIAYHEFARQTLKKYGAETELASLPIKFDNPIYGRNDANFVEYMYPGAMIQISFFMALALTALGFILEKKNGLLERCYTAGASSIDVMCSHTITQFGIMSFQITFMLIIVIFGFQFPSKGNIFLVIVMAFLHGLAGMAFGFSISVICDNEETAITIGLGIFFPFILLSGNMWPLEGMPKYLQTFSKLLPQTLSTDAVRSILSRGMTLADTAVWMGFLSIFVWLIIFFVTSIIVLKIKG